MRTVSIVSDAVFLAWAILRLTFHIGSGNTGWAAAFGAFVLFAVISLVAGIYVK